jgi:hypothetical protein
LTEKSEKVILPDGMKYAILALNPDNGFILHFCGYFTKPKYLEYINLYKELKTDPQFALQDQEFLLVPAEDEELQKLLDTFKESDPEDIEVVSHDK